MGRRQRRLFTVGGLWLSIPQFSTENADVARCGNADPCSVAAHLNQADCHSLVRQNDVFSLLPCEYQHDCTSLRVCGWRLWGRNLSERIGTCNSISERIGKCTSISERIGMCNRAASKTTGASSRVQARKWPKVRVTDPAEKRKAGEFPVFRHRGRGEAAPIGRGSLREPRAPNENRRARLEPSRRSGCNGRRDRTSGRWCKRFGRRAACRAFESRGPRECWPD